MLRKAGKGLTEINWEDEEEPGRTERTQRERMRPALVFCLGVCAGKKAGLWPGMPSFRWFGDTPESGCRTSVLEKKNIWGSAHL